MATTHIGIRVPNDLDREAGPAYSAYRSDTGMEYELHECTDGIGAIIGVSPESGGETHWYRTGGLIEGAAWIDDALELNAGDSDE